VSAVRHPAESVLPHLRLFWLERGNAILEPRQKIKEKTIKLQKQLHQQKLVA